ncbi:MAG: flagellar export protein FliJ [Lachnospiraceae bacterium]|nr:flagellar export protein FliJ [Lachnospiraceae bacterium]
MAKFVYRMQNILDIKEKLETQEKIAFSAAMNHLNEEEEKLRVLMKRQAEYEAHLKEIMDGRIDVVKINEAKRAVESIKGFVLEQMKQVRRAQKNLELARERLNNAQKERKTHEALKDRAFEEFLQEQNAEEMKQIDQLVSYTYGAKALEKAGEEEE